MRFTKYEGLGNDFIVVDDEAGREVDSALARGLCDRHFGIGADGVLLVEPGRSAGARATMTVLNADGSRPEMCGNGLRCVALHLALIDGQPTAEYRVDTDAGPRQCRVSPEGTDRAQVLIEMGQVRTEPSLRFEREGRTLEFLRVSTGNPHAILFDLPVSPGEVDALGPAVSAAIAGGSNVEFVTAAPGGGFDVVVWERGVGRTLACGTGAVATAFAAISTGRARFDRPIRVTLPGGSLEVTVAETEVATLCGPARRIFSGEVVVPKPLPAAT